LNAPPRHRCAPAALTSFAIWQTWSSLSTEQGPAIIWKFPPPIFTSPLGDGMLIIVSLGWNFLFAFLYGSCTRFTSSTISRAFIRSVSTVEVSPRSPRMVVFEPWLKFISRFMLFNQDMRLSSCFFSGFSFNTIIIIDSPCLSAETKCKKNSR